MRREAPVRLHAHETCTVEVGGDDEPSVRASTTERIAALLADPPEVILTSSCTAALEASATALDLAAGDEVIVPAFTFPTTAIPFLIRGATVRFADVCPRTGNIEPEQIAQKLGPRTRAVVCTHYAGVGAGAATIKRLLNDDRVDVVEDAAQGLFGSEDGRPLGRTGRFGCLSFHRTKNISAIEGGALIVNDQDDVHAMRVAVDKGTNRVQFESGLTSAYEWSGAGSAARMAEPALRVLAAALGQAGERQTRRQAVWERYAEALRPWAERSGVQLPEVPEGRHHPAHLFYVLVPTPQDRPVLAQWCDAAGVEVAHHFGSLPSSRFGRTIALPGDDCPVAGDFASRLLRLPLHHRLSDADVDHVVEVVSGAPLK